MIILAGIGFELRKLIKKDDKLSYIKTYLFSSIVTIGPTVLCIMLITFFQILMLQQNVKIATREFYMAATMYCFIFSIIIVGVFNMPLSRYVSDLIFEKKREKILPSMFGTIIACIVLGGVICVSFLWGVNCTFLEKLLIYLLFVVLIIIWVEMIFISAIDDYKSVIRGFSIGVSIGVITALILTIMNVFKISYVLFFSNVLTFTIIAISFMITLLKILNFSIKYNYFEFIKSIDKHKKLIITSFLLTLSVYTHNFVFWFSEVGITVKQVLHFAPNYDIATFFAFLSVMPSLVIFVVSMETSFYTGFKRYLSKIENGETLEEIKETKKEVSNIFKQKMQTLMEIQIIFSLAALITGQLVLPRLGVSSMVTDMFSTLVPGYYFYICMYVVILILLYFDDQTGALLVTVSFFVTSMLFTLITIKMGKEFYGTGFCLSSFFSLVLAFVRLKRYFENLEYHIFSSGDIEN